MKKSKKVIAVLLCLLAVISTLYGCTGKQNADDTSDAEKISFLFKVTDADGNEFEKEITTTEETVGAALLKEGLISGDDGPYGLYVKTVNGITLNFDTDFAYWGFYIDGTYADKGVDQTEIVSGTTYEFRIETNS